MNAKVTFFPLGNADTTLIQLLDTNKTILWDYANKKTDETDDKRCDLPIELNKRISGDYDVVCFTHSDEDHIHRMSEYFYLEHAQKYQNEDRKKIKELWVPAAIIIDTESNNDDDATLKAEARYRLKQGFGIKVFSKPDKLKDWLNKNDIEYEKVKHLIVDAGKTVPNWDKKMDGIEFFVHAPFMGHVDENNEVDRNGAGIIVQATFGNTKETRLMLGADGKAEIWSDVVAVTKFRENHHRLEWDIFHISHHCSYLSLNEEEKGEEKTIPNSNVKWLFESQGNTGCLLVSPSKVILFEDTDQPPHFQAYKYYKEDVADKKQGELKVTMEHPNKNNPKSLEIVISEFGFKVIIVTSDESRIAAAFSVAQTSVVSGNWSYDK